MRKTKMVTVSIQSSAAAGSTMTITVTGLVAGEQVGGGFTIPPNSSIPIPGGENGKIYIANSQGKASWQWHILAEAAPGSYQWFIAGSQSGTVNGSLEITAAAPGSGIMEFIKKNALWIAGGVLALVVLSSHSRR